MTKDRQPHLFLVLLLLVAFAPDVRAAAPAPTAAFFERHCFECHDADTKKGELDLTALSPDVSDPANFTRWVKVHDRIESGEMPPKKKPRPDPAELQPVLHWMTIQLATAERTRRSNSGRAIYRRLTRAEYESTLQDLLDLPGMPVREDLPADGSAFGFNKVSEALDISHVQMAKYMEVAKKAIDRSVAIRPEAPIPFKRRFYAAEQYSFKNGLTGGDAILLKDKQPDPAFPPPTDEKFPKEQRAHVMGDILNPSTSAVGVFRHTDEGFNPGFQSFSPITPGWYRIRLSVWSYGWDKGKVLPSPRTQVVGIRSLSQGPLGFFDATSLESKEYTIETWLEPNDMLLFNASSLEEITIYNRKGRAAEYQGPGVAIDWLDVEGPLTQAWPPPSHVKLFGGLPVQRLDTPKPDPKLAAPKGKKAPPVTAPVVTVPLPEREPPPKTRRRDSRWPGKNDDHGKVEGVWSVVSTDPKADAHRLLKTFMPMAFRRPVNNETVDRYAAIVAERLAGGDCFEDAMKMAYQTILCSPEFLFRLEPEGKLDDWAIASRLSYFLWDSMPDAELMKLAAAGELTKSGETLRGQVRRMLKDPRSLRFVADFLDQWLALNEIAATTPDKTLYPEFKPYLQECMLGETRAYFRQMMDGNLGVRFLVDSDFAMLNGELARLYGVGDPTAGDAFTRVTLPAGSHRGGLLTQAAILKVTANGTTTSPVKRGAWVMDRLLGKRPDPPPPSVTAIDPDLRGTTTIREQLDKHRSNASCAACHAKMDPPGFSLESYDVIGRWRDHYRSKEEGEIPTAKVGEGHIAVKYRIGLPVDCTGQTVDGTPFKDIDEFKKILMKDERQIARNLLQRFAVYATGSEVGFSDRPAIEKILDACHNDHATGPYGIQSLIQELVVSDLFLTK